MTITQKDIAKRLNLARVTVTKALKDHPDIAPETKEKVKDMASELGYVPNFIARNLSTRRTRTIGVVVPKINHSFFSTAVESLYKFLLAHGYGVILEVSFEDKENEIKNIQTLLSMRVDGIIVDVSQDTKDDEIYEMVRSRNVPLVFFDRVIENPHFSYVRVNDREAAFQAVEYAIKQGYKRLAHLGGYSNISIGKERCAGFVDALKNYGMPIKKEWIIEGGLVREHGYRDTRVLFQGEEKPDFIFTVNDSVAQGVYDAAKEMGVIIPEDLAVIGFGDIEVGELLVPPLTTMHMPIEKMTQKAVELLIEEIENPDKAKKQKMVFQSEIKIRESTLPEKR